jgi:hypothetical protein
MTKAAELAKMGEVLTNSQIGGRRNMIINGAMQVAQRGELTGCTVSQYTTCDRFLLDISSLGTWTTSQSTDVPSGQGFANSLKLDCTTADASPSAGDFMILNQRIEGYNLQALAKGSSSANPMTLSFWVKSTKTGTYVVEMYDNDNTRTFSKAYTISSADTWEKKTLTYDGDTTGTFDNDNNTSLQIFMWLGAGSNYTSGTISEAWGSRTLANAAAGQVNIADSTDNNFYITGLQVEVGSQATPFEHRSFGEELSLCERYFVECFSGDSVYESGSGTGWAFSTTGTVSYRPFRVQMRAKPTVSWSGSGTIHVSDDISASSNVTNIVTNTGVTSRDFMYIETTSSGLTQYRNYHIRANGTTTNASLRIDAEL